MSRCCCCTASPTLRVCGAIRSHRWYRANVDVETWKPEGWVLPRTPVPTLGVWSSGDAYLTEVQMATSGNYVDGRWDYLRVEGASHWLMLDRPAHIAKVLVDYLQ